MQVNMTWRIDILPIGRHIIAFSDCSDYSDCSDLCRCGRKEDSMATQAIPIRLENEEEAQVVRKLYRMLIHDGTAALVGPDNSKIDLPPTIYKVLVAIVKDMQEGKSIGLIPVMEELSTQAAADMLGVSRQFLVNELEAGKLAFHRTGTHRKVYLKDLVAYQEQRGMNRKDAIRRIAQASEELGIYNQFVPFDE
jgi:excisionase family DNA binding protein